MKSSPVALILTLTAAATLVAQDLPEWVLNLSRIKRHTRAELQHLPNYTCFETVARYDKAASAHGFKQHDVLRLEVAVVDGKESLSLAGASRFGDDQLPNYVDTGMFGTGTFSATTSNLFINDNSRSTGWGKESMNDRPAFRYDYEIAQPFSGFHLASDSFESTVGVKGTFWVDAGTLDLIRIEQEAVDIPPLLLMDRVMTSVDYARTRIGSKDVLLPQSAEILVVNSNASQRKNLVEFSGCREYQSESVLRFDSDTAAPPAPRKKQP